MKTSFCWFLLFFLHLTIVQTAARGNDPTFEHLSLEKGISHNLTRCIYQDRKGFMWFGTMFGLIKFDGRKYTIYRNQPSDSLSISHDDILCIHEDGQGNLWIGTKGGGLNKFDQNTAKFIRYVHDPQNPLSLSNNHVHALCEDRQGNLWIGTENGLNKLEQIYTQAPIGTKSTRNVIFQRYYRDLWDMTSLSDDWIQALYEDDHGNLWVGTRNGLNHFNPQSKKFIRYQSFNPQYTKIYHPDVDQQIDQLKYENKQIAGIYHPAHFEKITQIMDIKKTTYVLIHCLGEGRSEFRGEPVQIMSDFGMLYNEKDEIVWKMAFENTNYAGGAEKNRLQIEVIKLPPGRYKLIYRSDDSHAYDDWNSAPPDRASDWGIQVYALRADEVNRLRNLLKDKIATRLNSISSNSITAISKCAGKNLLWIGTAGGGVNQFDLNTQIFTHFRSEPANPNALVNDYINTLFEDDNCLLWIGTSGGISVYDYSTAAFKTYMHDPLNSNSLSSNFVYAIFKDISGIIWCGTYWGGIDKLDFKKQPFTHIRKSLSRSSKLAENNFQAICGADEKKFWIGTWGDGLILYDRQTHTFRNFASHSAGNGSISSDFIRTLYRDSKNNLWIGTLGGGLNRFIVQSNSFSYYLYDSRDANTLSSNFVTAILEDDAGSIWVGTEDGGLNRLKSNGKSFERFQYSLGNRNGLSSNTIYCLYMGTEDKIWIGTAAGLNLFDQRSGKFLVFKSDARDSGSLSNNYVYTIHQACNGRDSSLWVGTAGGLNRFDPLSGKFERFTEENGLPNRVICGILEDQNGYLWISTNKGLSRFDPENRIFKNYDLIDGLQSNMFNIGSFYQFSNGELAFGGINGLNIFNPAGIISNTFVPPVYITGFRRFNQPMEFGQALSDLQEIKLEYTDNFFTLEFAALDFSHPEKNSYAYKLDGVNDRWIYCENDNFASYTNLNPGRYKFRVRGTNSDGIWNMQGTSIDIVIRPPFWMTWWFRTLVIVLITAAISAIVFSFIRREKQKTVLNKKISELKLRALQAQMNPHFIFNTMNAIQYFISKKDQDSAYFYLSKFSKLLRRMLENSGKLTISLAEELETLKLYLELQLLRYEQKFVYQIQVDSPIDKNIIEIPTMVLQPYIENAILHGFTKNDQVGQLKISVKLNDKFLVCLIEDNGIGIRQSLKLKENKITDHISSGMKLTKERLDIVNATHKNRIGVTVQDLSECPGEGQGTRVTLHIPIHN